MTSTTDLTTVVATYRVRAEREKEFRAPLTRHHPTLVRLGLATAQPPTIYRGVEHGGGPIWFEIFAWVDAAAPGKAHENADVMAIWGPMGEMLEDRPTGPKMGFPHVEAVSLRG
jgi:hypothetical protein